jgi:SRSO17 transposase
LSPFNTPKGRKSKENANAPSPLEGMGFRFQHLIKGYNLHFRRGNRSMGGQAEQYLQGLMQAQRKNIERMEEVVPDSDYQSLHHFLSESEWDARAVLDQVARDADGHLGGTADSCLLLDETAFAKKGRKSVGVARQWSGRLGKVDNCQVGVFACLAQGPSSTVIDARLYLPKEWTDDAARCQAAGIPRDAVVFKSKADLALEMVVQARQNGVRFGWVGVDGGYGKEPAFLRRLEDQGEIFVADVHKSQQIYLSDPDPFLPAAKKSVRGRKPSRLEPRSESQRVDEWLTTQPAECWHRVTVRPGTKGDVRVEALQARVWLWDGDEPKARLWHLVVTREADSTKTIKFTLSNAPAQASVERLVQMQRQRFFIERSFEDGKSEMGMADYQVRGWLAWHHHMALVALAMLFMLAERLTQKVSYPLLSCADVEALLAHFLPRRDVTVAEVIRQMEVRHAARQRSVDSAYRRQRLSDTKGK